MQVMHFHAGEFDCDSDDLLQVEANICHGARVFGHYLKRTGNVQRALLRYNGCVSGTNTPNCHRYPAKVLRDARQVRRELLQYPPYSLAVDTAAFDRYRPSRSFSASPTFRPNSSSRVDERRRRARGRCGSARVPGLNHSRCVVGTPLVGEVAVGRVDGAAHHARRGGPTPTPGARSRQPFR